MSFFKETTIDRRCLNCQSTVAEVSAKGEANRPNACSYTGKDGKLVSNCPYDTGRLKR